MAILRKADDAIRFDNHHATIEEAVSALVEIIQQRRH